MTIQHSYKESLVYQKNKELVKDVFCFFRQRRADKLSEYFINQLIRAISSVCVNLAEGYGRYYKQDYRRFISISRGSAFEADSWLDIIVDLKIFPTEPIKEFSGRNIEIIRFLTAMMKNLDKSPTKAG